MPPPPPPPRPAPAPPPTFLSVFLQYPLLRRRALRHLRRLALRRCPALPPLHEAHRQLRLHHPARRRTQHTALMALRLPQRHPRQPPARQPKLLQPPARQRHQVHHALLTRRRLCRRQPRQLRRVLRPSDTRAACTASTPAAFSASTCDASIADRRASKVDTSSADQRSPHVRAPPPPCAPTTAPPHELRATPPGPAAFSLSIRDSSAACDASISRTRSVSQRATAFAACERVSLQCGAVPHGCRCCRRRPGPACGEQGR